MTRRAAPPSAKAGAAGRRQQAAERPAAALEQRARAAARERRARAERTARPEEWQAPAPEGTAWAAPGRPERAAATLPLRAPPGSSTGVTGSTGTDRTAA